MRIRREDDGRRHQPERWGAEGRVVDRAQSVDQAPLEDRVQSAGQVPSAGQVLWEGQARMEVS